MFSSNVQQAATQVAGVFSGVNAHALITIPSTAANPSSIASLGVGCAWIVNIKCSTVPSNSITATAYAINRVVRPTPRND
jgi:hypothetical protein